MKTTLEMPNELFRRAKATAAQRGQSLKQLVRSRYKLGSKRMTCADFLLCVDNTRWLAILDGRSHDRPQAPSASQSVYRHGGPTLMEMLTPWLVLGPVGSDN